MRHLYFLLFLTISSFALADEESEHVVDLTQENFDRTIEDNDYVLVKFYAPWCGHCKALAPEYEKAAKQLKDEGVSVILGKVDATVHTDLGSRFKVQGYPTLKFFKKGAELEYNGPRKGEGIVGWIKKKLGPALEVLSSAADLDKFKSDNEVVAVYFSKDENSEAHKVVSDVAIKMEGVAFTTVKDDSLAKEIGLSASEPLVLLKKFDDPKVVYTGKYVSEDIEKFIKMEQVPLVTIFSQETAQIVFASEIKTHLIAFSGKKASDYEKHLAMLKDVAIPLKGKCHVVVIDMDDAESARVAEFFGVDSKILPTFRVIQMQEEIAKFLPEKSDFTSEYLIQFAKDVLDGKVKVHLKSADEPADWDKEPVKVLVASSFKDRAVSADKAVFVKFYAPWCGHCKSLAPIWDELGAHYNDNKEVVIAKCDSTENEFEDIKINSFPTLKFSPKGSTEFMDYSGERTKEDFIKFIDANGKVEQKPKDDKHDEL